MFSITLSAHNASGRRRTCLSPGEAVMFGVPSLAKETPYEQCDHSHDGKDGLPRFVIRERLNLVNDAERKRSFEN
jgi:hypothetical protein